MADGRVKAIQDVHVGDLIENAAPDGSLQVHRIDHTYVTTTDTAFTDLTIVSDGRRSTITGTQNHPYYDLTRRDFVNAGQLAVGDLLKTTGSATAVVDGIRNYPAASMVTYDLTVDGEHTYFVLAGTTPVLVHNISGCGIVTYGSDDMSRMAFEYRIAKKINPGMNVAVFEYETGSGPGYISTANIPGGAHSEEIVDKYLKSAGIDPKSVTRIYSERVPCSTAKHECAGIVGVANYPKAAVTWSFSGTSAQNYVSLQSAMAYGIG